MSAITEVYLGEYLLRSLDYRKQLLKNDYRVPEGYLLISEEKLEKIKEDILELIKKDSEKKLKKIEKLNKQISNLENENRLLYKYINKLEQ